MYFLDNCAGLGQIVALIKDIVGIAFILIGIALVVLIIIDIAKAIIAGDEKEVKTAQKSAIRRVIYFVVLFFVVTLVTFVFNILGRHTDTNGDSEVTWIDCWNDPLNEK